MRRMLGFLLACLFSQYGYCRDVSLIPDNTEESDSIAQDITSTLTTTMADLGGRGDFVPLENYVKEHNPELYNQAQSDTHAHQRMVYRSFMMKDIFDKYKNHYVQDITNMSNTTGRKLITEEEESVGKVIKVVDGIEQSWRLDEEPFRYDCGYPPQVKHTKAEEWCHLRDDFEEYRVEYRAYGYGYNKQIGDNLKSLDYRHASGEHLDITKSVLSENRYSYYSFDLDITINSDEAKVAQKYGLIGEYRLAFIYHDVNREEQYKYWNQEVDDMLAGKVTLTGKFCNSSGECMTVWSDKNPEKWKSNHMIPIGRVGNFFGL